MATGSLPASTAKPEQERFIERQLNKTRRQVKFVELGVAGVTLAVGVLAFFLVAALIDHWLLPLGHTGRFAMLAVLLGGVGWYLWYAVVPLVRNSINPAYAALTIEHSAPTLKNSLINFLMLRSQRGQVHDVVYEAVETRAATDLREVPMDSVIDYGPLIKVGYVLAGIFAVTAAYKMLSPKDPLQTVARVAAPWADISRPSRVQIENITPGDAEHFFGDTVTVSAELRGVRSSDRIALVYSTADGQTIDKVLEMTPNETGDQYTAALPAEGAGLHQDVTYRIEAGDAVSRDYRLTVVAAPTIVVDKVDYDYPRYTQKARESRERTGDIRALEGTRVTLHARANQPIHAAYIEFDPAGEGAADASAKRPRVQMEVSGQEAKGSFVLELQGDRTTPKHGSYQITFMTAGGHPGQQPAFHTIDVIRDLAPEIEILAPKEQQTEVPENGEAVVEVRAVDPDFALARVGIKLHVDSRQVADRALLESSAGHNGQSVTKFRFRPAEYKLKAGDEVAWWATTADNRTAPQTGLPEPNTERTKNYFFKIVPADPNAKPQQDNQNGGEQDQPKDGNPPPMPNDDQPPQDKNQNDNGGKQGDSKDPMQDPQEDAGEKPMNDKGNEGNQGGKNDKSEEGSAGSKSEKQDGGQGGKSDKPNDQPMPEKGSDDEQDMTDGASGGKQDGAGNKSDQPQEGGKQEGMNPSGADSEQGSEGGNSEGSQPQDGSNEGGDSKNEQGGSKGQNDRNNSGKPNGNGNKTDSGQNEDQHDGDVFEKTLERMIEQAEREQKGGGSNKKPGDGDSGKQPTQEDFDKLPEHLKEKLKKLMEKHQQQKGDSQKTDKAPPGVQNDSPKDSAKGGTQSGEQTGEQPDAEQGPKPDGQSQTGDGGDEKQPMPGGTQGADKKQGAGASNERSEGDTGKPDDAANTRPEEKSATGEPASEEKRQGGQGTNGQSGAGQPSTNKQGSAQTQEANRDKPKTQKSGEQKPGQGDEAQSPSNSKKQSDSQGGEGGDRSGGGKQGAGQGGNTAGNDKAGSNSVADEGAGAANQSGEGDTSAQGGDKKKAEGKTGKSGTEEGEGSTTKKGPRGDRSPNDPQLGENSETPESPMPGEQGDAEGQGGAGDFVTGGGKPSDNTGRSKFADAEGPAAEKAKLDYAKNATDLVLEYLKDQKDKPDQELLDDLGWTKEDMNKFLERWAEAKREAADDPKAQGELNEALRSLGLRPTTDKLRRGETKSDNNRGLGDVGPTTGPPSKYIEQFRAFKKGAAREK